MTDSSALRARALEHLEGSHTNLVVATDGQRQAWQDLTEDLPNVIVMTAQQLMDQAACLTESYIVIVDDLPDTEHDTVGAALRHARIHRVVLLAPPVDRAQRQSRLLRSGAPVPTFTVDLGTGAGAGGSDLEAKRALLTQLTADAYTVLGSLDASHPAVMAGLRSDSTDEDIDQITADLLDDPALAPFNPATLGPALTTWREDLRELER